jgi:hypothetical protein
MKIKQKKDHGIRNLIIIIFIIGFLFRPYFAGQILGVLIGIYLWYLLFKAVKNYFTNKKKKISNPIGQIISRNMAKECLFIYK